MEDGKLDKHACEFISQIKIEKLYEESHALLMLELYVSLFVCLKYWVDQKVRLGFAIWPIQRKRFV